MAKGDAMHPKEAHDDGGGGGCDAWAEIITSSPHDAPTRSEMARTYNHNNNITTTCTSVCMKGGNIWVWVCWVSTCKRVRRLSISLLGVAVM